MILLAQNIFNKKNQKFEEKYGVKKLSCQKIPKFSVKES